MIFLKEPFIGEGDVPDSTDVAVAQVDVVTFWIVRILWIYVDVIVIQDGEHVRHA